MKNKYKIISGIVLCIVFIYYTFVHDYLDKYKNFFSANIINVLEPAFDGAYLPIQDKFYYTTMYLGSYEKLGEENVGSHAGVDFATRRGTPIYAVANGVVVTAKYGYFGEGNFVVIKHTNVPSLEDENIKTTYYSIYLHMESLPIVNVGDIVKRGQLIGYVGSTGFSTGPHLHFQIDKSFAPFHPYSSSDIEKVRNNTIHPLQWISKYKNFNIDKKLQPNQDKNYKDMPGDEVIAKNNDDIKKIYNQSTSLFEISGDKFAIKGNAINLNIIAKNYLGDVDTSYKPKNNILLISSDDLNINPSVLTLNDFENGVAKIFVISHKEGEYDIKVDDGMAYGNSKVYFIEDVRNPNKYSLKSDKKSIYVGQSIEINANVLDILNRKVPNYKMVSKYANISVEPNDAGYFEPDKLEQKDFDFGSARFRFIATKAYDNVKIKLQEGVLVGFLDINIIKSDNPFLDVDPSSKYYDAIKYLKTKGIVQGYSDGTFRPYQYVSRAEMLKIILLGLKIPIESDTIVSFSDVPISQWYSPYVHTAKKLNIINGYPDGTFQPNKTINKVEALKIALQSKNVVLPKVEKNICSDVRYTDWYAPYVKYAFDNNIVDIPKDGKFLPAEMMNRGMIADIIYRMQK